jgi:hypothetical protein
MKSVKYEGGYPYMHNNSINHSEIIPNFKEKKKLLCSFESWSRWKKRKEK